MRPLPGDPTDTVIDKFVSSMPLVMVLRNRDSPIPGRMCRGEICMYLNFVFKSLQVLGTLVSSLGKMDLLHSLERMP
jgi:hypothetical protein